MTGSMCNHFVRMCKLMYEALTRMLITEMERYIESIEDVYRMLSSDWNNESCYHEFVNSDGMKSMSWLFMITSQDFLNKVHWQHSG